jgi:hypothetical protein
VLLLITDACDTELGMSLTIKCTGFISLCMLCRTASYAAARATIPKPKYEHEIKSFWKNKPQF